MLARIRKAVVAGAGAALATGAGAVVQSAMEGDVTEAAVSRAIGLGIAAGVTVGLATWRARNAGTVAGSAPTPGATLTR